MLLGLIFFFFAIAAMNLFGTVKHGYFIDQHGNFETFFNSFVTLVRCVCCTPQLFANSLCSDLVSRAAISPDAIPAHALAANSMSTGENWNGIMRDCMVQPPFCTAGVNCGSTVISPIFFIVFMICTAFMFISVVAAVIMQQVGRLPSLRDTHPLPRLALDQFEIQIEREKSAMNRQVLKVETVLDAIQLWSHMSHSKILRVSRLPDYLRALPLPLGLKGVDISADNMLRFVDALHLPTDKKHVHYCDVIHQVAVPGSIPSVLTPFLCHSCVGGSTCCTGLTFRRTRRRRSRTRWASSRAPR